MHFIWGDNNICHQGYEFIIKLNEPRVYIKFALEEALTATYSEFYDSIADVQWIDGEKPDNWEEILIDAFNFLCIEERLLDQDLDDLMEDF